MNSNNWSQSQSLVVRNTRNKDQLLHIIASVCLQCKCTAAQGVWLKRRNSVLPTKLCPTLLVDTARVYTRPGQRLARKHIFNYLHSIFYILNHNNQVKYLALQTFYSPA